MRIIVYLALFVSLVRGAADAHSGKLHCMEKFFFYFNYQIDGLLGEDTFASGCAKDGKRCNYHDFVQHITGKEAPKKAYFDEPPTDQGRMRTLAQQMITRKGKELASAQLKNEKVMSSLEDVDEKKRYETLYKKTSEWVTEVESRISELPGDKKEEANKLKNAAKSCIEDVRKMRRAGFASVELKEAKKHWQTQTYQDSQGNTKNYNIEHKPIAADENGGHDKYYEIDWDKTFEKSEQGDFKKKLDDWRKDRTTGKGSAAQHVAVEEMVNKLHGCYP